METQEVLDKTAIAISMLEWEHDISIAAALEIDMKRVKDWERLKERIAESKKIASVSPDVDFRTIYTSAMSYIEGCMAEMENEDGEN
jgi:hypothetical protein